MIYLFSAIYVLCGITVLLCLWEFIATGLTWGAVIRLLISLLWGYSNYRFMQYYFKNQRRSKNYAQKKEKK